MEKEIIKNLQHPVQFVTDSTSVALHIQNALGYSMPPFIPFKQIVTVNGANNTLKTSSVAAAEQKALASLGDTYFQSPLTLSTDTFTLKLPVDPVISVSSKNLITRRYIAKSEMRGSIKEWWSTDDWRISISGVLIAEQLGSKLLNEYIKQLRNILEHNQSVALVNDTLNDGYNIRYIAIESYNFPFTKGVENQSFSLSGYSDDSYSLLK